MKKTDRLEHILEDQFVEEIEILEGSEEWFTDILNQMAKLESAKKEYDKLDKKFKSVAAELARKKEESLDKMGISLHRETEKTKSNTTGKMRTSVIVTVPGFTFTTTIGSRSVYKVPEEIKNQYKEFAEEAKTTWKRL